MGKQRQRKSFEELVFSDDFMFGKVMEAPELRLGDGTAKIFYNCCYKGKDIPEGLGNLYDYIETGHAGSTLTKRIDEAVVRGRRNEMR